MNKSFYLLAGIALAWPVLALGQTVDYRGRVLEKAAMKPVFGATVKLGGTSLSATTDSSGRFRITGSVGLGDAPAAGVEFRLEGSSLRLGPAARERIFRVEVFDGSGRLAGARTHRVPAGGGSFELAPEGRDLAGFVRLTLGSCTWVARLVSVAGVATLGEVAEGDAGLHSKAMAKSSASGLTVSREGLVTKTLSPSSSSGDLGDIVLEYPPRKVGVGTPPPYGAHVLLPTGVDAAAFKAWFEKEWIHKVTSWRQSQGLGPTPLLWKVVDDPEPGPGGAARPSLSPCCEPRNGSKGWDYDDIITKKTFKDYQVHVEFNMMGLNDGNTNTSGYCNSGIYLTGNHELQIETPKSNPSNYDRLHGMATLLDFKVPDKNMYPGPGKWQSYDITFRAPRNGGEARITVYWNGERVHNNVSWKSGNGNPVGFALQNELGSDVRYRNIWLKELDIPNPETDFGY